MSDFEFERINTIKGYPELHWTGKRPYRGTDYYPAQLKEKYGEIKDDWINKIFWGDNLQVMSHMLREYRGKIDLIYIDPPFDSKADYKMKIELKGKQVKNDNSSFEEKQYTDIWSNDEYLQFMYERIILLRELLKNEGSIFIHCDWHKSHYIRMIADEIFGKDNLRNEIAWIYTGPGSPGMRQFNRKHDTILWYSKSDQWTFNSDEIRIPSEVHVGGFNNDMGKEESSQYAEKGKIPEDWWEFAVAARRKIDGCERSGYPTEKPMNLVERIIKACSNPGEIVFDCFMGGGTTPAVAMKNGRKFIGADINLGAIQLTTKRLLNIGKKIEKKDDKYTGFEVYNVNNYDFFRNPIEAKDLLIDALGIQKFNENNIYDGELDGRMVKIMPVNRIATKSDLEELKVNLPYQKFEKRKNDNPLEPVEKITIVCMGHEPDLKPSLEQDLNNYNIDIEILDVLKDKTNLQFKRESEAVIEMKNNKLIVKEFYPMNLLQKLSIQKEYVEDWKQMVESIMIDWNYDGAVMEPEEIDIAEKDNLVKGIYEIPKNVKWIKIKITDLLSETFEKEIRINE